jgi:hypothetical protein
MENTKVVSNINQDDEAWLYGGSNEGFFKKFYHTF